MVYVSPPTGMSLTRDMTMEIKVQNSEHNVVAGEQALRTAAQLQQQEFSSQRQNVASTSR